jgi:hypothetical protein
MSEDEAKVAKMKQLTEPVVNDMLGVVRHVRHALRNMRTMAEFTAIREHLQLLVELRNLLADHPLVPGATYTAAALPLSHYADAADAARLAAVANGSLHALWAIEMKLYHVRNEISRVESVPRAVELTVLLRQLRNAVPVDLLAAADNTNSIDDVNGDATPTNYSSSAPMDELSAALSALLSDGVAADELSRIHEISSADADALLRGQPVGTFLFRTSTRPHAVALSLIGLNNSTVHTLIQVRAPRHLEFDGVRYPSLAAVCAQTDVLRHPINPQPRAKPTPAPSPALSLPTPPVSSGSGIGKSGAGPASPLVPRPGAPRHNSNNANNANNGGNAAAAASTSGSGITRQSSHGAISDIPGLTASDAALVHIITAPEAIQMLTAKPCGTFLFRTSRQPNAIAVSVVAPDHSIVHSLIGLGRELGSLRFEDRLYPSLPDIASTSRSLEHMIRPQPRRGVTDIAAPTQRGRTRTGGTMRTLPKRGGTVLSSSSQSLTASFDMSASSSSSSSSSSAANGSSASASTASSKSSTASLARREGWCQQKKKDTWLLLLDGTLYWFKNSQSGVTNVAQCAEKPRGQVLCNAGCAARELVGAQRGSFVITDDRGGEQLFEAPNADEATRWVRAVIECVEVHRRRTGDSAPSMTGMLKLKGKKRFFMLRGDRLVWYAQQNDADALGSVAVRGAHPSVDDCVLVLEKNDAESLELVADSADVAHRWFCAVSESLRQLKQATNASHAVSSSDVVVTCAASVGDVDVVVQLSLADSPVRFKEAALAALRARGAAVDDADAYLLEVCGADALLLHENSALSTQAVFRECRELGTAPRLRVVAKHELLTRHQATSGQQTTLRDVMKSSDSASLDFAVDRARRTEVERLLGSEMAQRLKHRAASGDRELLAFRCALARERIEQESPASSLPEYCDDVLLERELPPELVLMCVMPGDAAKTIKVKSGITALAARDQLYEKFGIMSATFGSGGSVNDYVLKVMGYRAYLNSPRPLTDYDYVVEQLNARAPIQLALVRIPSNLHAHVRSHVDGMLAQLPDADGAAIAAATAEYAGALPDMRYVDELLGSYSVLIGGVSSVVPDNVENDVHRAALARGACDLYVSAQLVLGRATAGGKPVRTATQPLQADRSAVQFRERLQLPVKYAALPRAARLVLTLMATVRGDSERTEFALGSLAVPVDTSDGYLAQGARSLPTWLNCTHPPQSDTCVLNTRSAHPPRLDFALGTFAQTPLVQWRLPEAEATQTGRIFSMPTALERALQGDILTPLTDEARSLLRQHHRELQSHGRALPKYLLGVNWFDPDEARRVYLALQQWARPSPIEALALLSDLFADAEVRDYAVACLDPLSDADVADYLLQLTQSLKHERHNDSALARWLVDRALRAPDLVGHTLFWHLRGEIHDPLVAERSSMLLEQVLLGLAPLTRHSFALQCDVVEQLVAVAEGVKQQPEGAARLAYLHRELETLRFPERFQLPISHQLECRGLDIKACKVMKSKKMPLYLSFVNADHGGPGVKIIFKTGDDLRQDQLSLQLIKLMAKLWRREYPRLPLHMSLYAVAVTGPDQGLLEVVQDAETIGAINREAGGASQVLKTNTLYDWLRRQCDDNDEKLAVAQNRFAMSAAAYCGATYILGIGDRHNDNIMLKRDGSLFHIDFGHFLGHFKKKFGFDREKGPFVFTAQYSHVLGGRKGKDHIVFEQTLCKFFACMRGHVDLLVSLLVLSLPSGLPELESEDDIAWVRDKLALDLTSSEAMSLIRDKVDQALNTKSQTLMDVIHIVKHA